MCLSGFCSDREERSFQPLQTCSCAKSQPRFGECGWPMHAHNQNKDGSDRKVHKEWERHKKELVWRPHDVCRSVAIDSLESCWPLCSMCLTIRRPCAGILCGHNFMAECCHSQSLPLCYNTVDCRIFSSEEILTMDLLQRWRPIMESHWNSKSCWEQAILS